VSWRPPLERVAALPGLDLLKGLDQVSSSDRVATAPPRGGTARGAAGCVDSQIPSHSKAAPTQGNQAPAQRVYSQADLAEAENTRAGHHLSNAGSARGSITSPID
jgi:hypothetical protein